MNLDINDIFAWSNLKKDFPSDYDYIHKMFLDCKYFINTYAVINNLSKEEIDAIADTIFSTKFSHKDNTHTTRIFYILNFIVDNFFDIRNLYFFDYLRNVLKLDDGQASMNVLVYYMLKQYYHPLVNYSTWKILNEKTDKYDNDIFDDLLKLLVFNFPPLKFDNYQLSIEKKNELISILSPNL